MSYNVEGEKCPVCHSYLFEEDDIVFCPECGAPHHRSCYNNIGHCALELSHGTDLQYDMVKKAKDATREPKDEPVQEEKRGREYQQAHTRCGMCGNEIPQGARNCPHCGAPNTAAFAGFMNFDFLGGIPADMDIGDGVTADEAKKFVVANTPRYIPKFAQMKAGKKTSWNWLAFLIPWAWFASRKMYFYAVVSGIIGMASGILSNAMLIGIQELGVSNQQVTIFDIILSNISKIDPALIILSIAGLIISLILRIICAIYGDGIYRRYVITSIRNIRSTSEDQEADYRKKGGVSLVALLISVFIGQYLPAILISFLI